MPSQLSDAQRKERLDGLLAAMQPPLKLLPQDLDPGVRAAVFEIDGETKSVIVGIDQDAVVLALAMIVSPHLDRRLSLKDADLLREILLASNETALAGVHLIPASEEQRDRLAAMTAFVVDDSFARGRLEACARLALAAEQRLAKHAKATP
jgi:hypothetical protein